MLYLSKHEKVITMILTKKFGRYISELIISFLIINYKIKFNKVMKQLLHVFGISNDYPFVNSFDAIGRSAYKRIVYCSDYIDSSFHPTKISDIWVKIYWHEKYYDYKPYPPDCINPKFQFVSIAKGLKLKYKTDRIPKCLHCGY